MDSLRFILLLITLTSLQRSLAQDFSKESVIQPGDKWVVPVRYDLAKWQVTEESQPLLDSLFYFLQQRDSLVIEIGVHMDSRGPKNKCMILSQKRAESEVGELMERGVTAERLISVGYGETRLRVTDQAIASLKTQEEKEAAHLKNRRTEIVVLRTDYHSE